MKGGIQMNTKMYVEMKDGQVLEVDTSTVFEDQYNVIDEDGNCKRVFDKDIKRIQNDIRLGEFYIGAGTQGSYEDVLKAIQEKRSKIEKCFDCKTQKRCFWYQCSGLEHLKREAVMNEDGSEIKTEITKYNYACAYKKEYGDDKCSFDIEEKPKLFREVNHCFFCKYPQGVPDNSDFMEFIRKNKEKYWIVRRGDYLDELNFDIANHRGYLGSYQFIFDDYWGHRNNMFLVKNARETYLFVFDFDNDFYIYKKLHNNSYSTGSLPITAFPKFDKWFRKMVNDYREYVQMR